MDGLAVVGLTLVGALSAGCSTASGVGVSADATATEPDATAVTVDATPVADAQIDAAGGSTLLVFGDDYGGGVVFAPFGGSTNGPSIVGADAHSGSTALRLEVPAAGYTGGAFVAGGAVDLSGFTAVTFWARASKAARLNVVGLGNDAASTTHWAEWTAVPLTTTWTRHVLPVPDAARLTAEHGLFHVAEGADEGAYTIWLDDIRYEVLAAGVLGPPRPAIATEAVARPVGAVFPLNGASVTFAVSGVDQTIALSRRYLSYQSSLPAVATVDDDGQVTAVAAGTTTITARLGAVEAVGALTFTVQP